MELEEIYALVNEFQAAPRRFVQERGWHAGCSRSLEVSYDPLVVLPQLEEGADWQVHHLDCGFISHETCPQYCHLFGSCSASDRIESFMAPTKVANPNEVLVQGPKRPLKHLIAKEGHCDHLLSPEANAMGGAIVGNLFIMSLVWLL